MAFTEPCHNTPRPGHTRLPKSAAAGNPFSRPPLLPFPGLENKISGSGKSQGNGRTLSTGGRRLVVALGLGQLVSLLVTATGFASSELSRRGINVPTSQSLLNYLLLAIVYGTILLRRRKPLQTKYRLRKYIGVAICAIGLVLVVFSDVHAGDRAGGTSPVKGDILVIAGATLYAISNVTEEFLVKASDQIELMGMMGLFGALISVCQISILERSEIESIHWNGAISGSTMLNLSLLTSDMWAILIRVFAYHEKVDWMYYVAFAAVAVGLVIYSCDSNNDDRRGRVSEAGYAEKKLNDEEAAANAQCQGAGSSCNQKSGDGKAHPVDRPVESLT
ncbi:hypothetical protein PR202_ga04267 [Eleusine coracana subsp. coracana]|uniref:Uncharacterized protein n=1 Tax=Eleusine coracana subsp. coracana TaxID=191504 RepID=A0AAV5BPI9_ELECO|nr:hypothetical protein PR202_ga04267 [Eleusine coracana subsp. coracana]